MDRVVPISEARANLSELLTEAEQHEVYILRHGRPAGVLLSVEAYERAMSLIEDLEDTVESLRSLADDDAVPFVPSRDRELVDA